MSKLQEILKSQMEEYDKLFDKGNPESIIHFIKRFNAKIIKAATEDENSRILKILEKHIDSQTSEMINEIVSLV